MKKKIEFTPSRLLFVQAYSWAAQLAYWHSWAVVAKYAERTLQPALVLCFVHQTSSSRPGVSLTLSLLSCLPMQDESSNRREIITVRGQSYVSRFPKYWPSGPHPLLPPASVSYPPWVGCWPESVVINEFYARTGAWVGAEKVWSSC
jgi:hypothetical protein